MTHNPPASVRLVAGLTRWIQGFSPRERVRGLTRVLNQAKRLLPDYAGEVQLRDGTRFAVDTGAQAVDFWVLYTGDFEPAITWMLKQHTRPGAYCLDIGANIGHYALRMATWSGAQGKVAAFEPDPAVAERIRRNVAANRYAHVEVVATAVSDQEEERTFYIGHKSIYSALDAGQVQQVTGQVRLTTVTIDGYLERAGWPRLDVVKIDTQGNDCRCILGGREAIRRFHPFIIFEYEAATPPEQAIPAFELLRSQGYRLQTLTPRGRLLPFNPDQLGSAYVDVACFPPGR